MRRQYLATPSRVLIPVIILAGAFAALLIVDQPVFCGLISFYLGTDVFKLLLQFLLITVIGGGVFAYFNARREEQLRADARIAGLQALDRELGEAHRAVKRVKRNMRAQLRRESDGSARIDQAAFEAALGDLLDAQIATEEVRESIAVRGDLLDQQAVQQLSSVLRYAARQLHDVFEDYERNRVQRDGGDFILDAASPNLVDFFLTGELPDAVRAEQARARDENASLSDRFAALGRIEIIREMSSESLRYGRVTTECFRVAITQIRASLAEAMHRAPYAPVH